MGDTLLRDVQILDFTHAFSGPLCTMMLAEMGAEVWKIEPPGIGDETRAWPPILSDGSSGYFAALNRSKKSVAVNLKQPEGLEAARGLAARANIVIENFTPGVAERLGVGYDQLRAVRPDVVYCSISGFGQSGPYRTRKGYDPILQAMGGLMGVTGEPGREPVKTMIPIADILTGSFACTALLAALHTQVQTGCGTYIDAAMLDIMASMLTIVGGGYLHTGTVPPRSGSRNPLRVPSSAFECAGGDYLQLVPNQRQWRDFCLLIGAPELADDERFATNVSRVDHAEELYPVVEERLRQKASTHWLAVFEEHGIACGPIYTLDQLFADPQVIDRAIVTHFQRPGAGEVPALRLPWLFDQHPLPIRSPHPDLGQHTVSVLKDVLGYGVAQLNDLTARGAIAS